MAEALSRAVLVDVDRIRDTMVVRGAELPSPEWPDELVAQLRAARTATIGIARAYDEIGFDVVIDDFLDPFTLLSEYDAISDLKPLRVALIPPPATARARNAARGVGTDYIDVGFSFTYEHMPSADELRQHGWTVMDTEGQPAAEVSRRVLALLA